MGGYRGIPLSSQNAGKALKSPNKGLRGTVYCCYTAPLAYLLSATWTPATEGVYGVYPAPKVEKTGETNQRKEKAMEALRRRPDAPGPYGRSEAERRRGSPGNGPRAAADGQPLGVGSGGRCAPAPSPNGAYQPPPAGELAAAGITNALPGTLSFCETE